MSFGLGGWLLSIAQGTAESALSVAARFRMVVAQHRSSLLASQPLSMRKLVATPSAFTKPVAVPFAVSARVAGTQTDLESEEIVAKKIWTDPIDQTSTDDGPDGTIMIKQGGIWVGVTSIPSEMIAPAFNISSFSAGTSIVEDGATVTNPSFTAAYTSSPTTVTVHDSVNATPQSITLPATSFSRTGTRVMSGLGTTWTFTLTAVKGAYTKTATATVRAGQRIYYGAASDGTYNEAFIEALSSSLVTGHGNTFTTSVSAGQRFFYGYPTAFSAPTVRDGTFDVELNDMASGVPTTNVNGVAISYELIATDIFTEDGAVSLSFS